MIHKHQEQSSGLSSQYVYRFTVRIRSYGCLKTVINELTKYRVLHNIQSDHSFCNTQTHISRKQILFKTGQSSSWMRSWVENKMKKCKSLYFPRLPFRKVKRWVSGLTSSLVKCPVSSTHQRRYIKWFPNFHKTQYFVIFYVLHKS